MGEIKTCEQYVLAEIDDLKRRNAALHDYNENMARDLRNYKKKLDTVLSMVEFNPDRMKYELSVWKEFDEDRFNVLEEIVKGETNGNTVRD